MKISKKFSIRLLDEVYYDMTPDIIFKNKVIKEIIIYAELLSDHSRFISPST